MVEIDVVYEGELRCSATHGPSGEKLFTDAPVDNQGKGESFSPTDLCATALATCMPTIMGIYAERHDDMDLTGLRVKIGKIMSAEPPRRIAKLEMTIEVPLPADHPQRKALERAALTCPVHQSLLPAIEIPIDWQWIG